MKRLTLETDQLRLRPLKLGDIDAVFALASDKGIADNTFVPHPYAYSDAEEFVRGARDKWLADEAYVFAITERSSGALAGVMGLHPNAQHKSAAIGFWIGRRFWGRGYATEALRRVIRFGFETLELNRIEAGHFSHNVASGRVQQKANMRHEGLGRQELLHRDGFKDVRWMAILREEYLAAQETKTAED